MNLRVLYLYAGPRRKIYDDYKAGKIPGIDLAGLHRMASYDIDATFLENRMTEFLRRISFNLVQLPVLFRLKSCDVIFAGSGTVTLFIVKFGLRLNKPKWIIYNTYLSRLLKQNTKGWKAWVIRKAIFSADAIISPSLSQSKFLASVGLPAEKNYYLPYGVEYDFFYRDTDSINMSGRYIFSAGRDIGRDYKTLIEAVRDLPIKLIISALPRNLNIITELPSNVTVSPFDPAQMVQMLKNSAFVVIPTIPEDEMGGSDCSGQYALLRSMACGKAVITSSRSTLAGYFMDGRHGLIVAPRDVARLKEAIMSLWTDPAKAKEMGENARQNVKNRFTIEIFSRRLAEIFREIAEG